MHPLPSDTFAVVAKTGVMSKQLKRDEQRLFLHVLASCSRLHAALKLTVVLN